MKFQFIRPKESLYSSSKTCRKERTDNVFELNFRVSFSLCVLVLRLCLTFVSFGVKKKANCEPSSLTPFSFPAAILRRIRCYFSRIFHSPLCFPFLFTFIEINSRGNQSCKMGNSCMKWEGRSDFLPIKNCKFE